MNAQQNPGCLFAILKLLGLAPRGSEVVANNLPYRQRDDFLSAAELSFFHVLRTAVGESFTICPKVRVADVLFVQERRNNQGYVNKIDRKHVDFVLCDPATMRPRVVVELDDASHQRNDRQDRDTFVDAAFTAAGLPVVRFPAQRQYDLKLVAVEIEAATSTQLVEAHAATPKAEPSGEAPSCPKCQSQMVIRTAKRGANEGKQFYACPNYPQCKSTLPVDG